MALEFLVVSSHECGAGDHSEEFFVAHFADDRQRVYIKPTEYIQNDVEGL